MVPLLLEIEQADAEARRVNDAKPALGYGDGRNLRAWNCRHVGWQGLASTIATE